MSSKKNWVLKVKSKFYRKLRRFPVHDQRQILEVIEALSDDPYFGDIEKMEGSENVWRRRVGAYRIFYEVWTTDKTIVVFRVERRTSKTYS